MKRLWIGLLFPVFTFGQTVHVEDDQIHYEGHVTVAAASAEDVLLRLKNALPIAAEKSKAAVEIETTDDHATAIMKIRLNSPFHIIRTLHFTLHVQLDDNGYAYRTENVFVSEKRRGGKETVKQSKELLEGVEETGNVAIETERLLNEIDLRLQKFLTLLEATVKTSTHVEK